MAAVEHIEVLSERLGLGVAARQQALAVALWRVTARRPGMSLQQDFVTERLVLSDGGRDIRAEVRMIPPELTPEVRHPDDEAAARYVQPEWCEHRRWKPGCLECRQVKEKTVTWRGSLSDLVTDLLGVLGTEGLEALVAEAKPRAERERKNPGCG